MIEQVSFELGRRDLEAAYLDELLDSVNDEDFVQFINDDFIAGVDPSVRMKNVGQVPPNGRLDRESEVAPINKGLRGSV